MSPCTLKCEIEQPFAIINLEGTLVYEDVPSTSEALKECFTEGIDYAIIDMEKIIRVNSKGLGALLSINKFCMENSKQFVILNPPEKVRQILEITKLAGILKICTGTIDDAKDLFAKG